MEELKKLQSLVDELRSTNSINNKKEILRKYSDDDIIKKLLIYTFDPYRRYHITSKNLKKLKDLQGDYVEFDDSNITDMLDNLTYRWVTGHTAIRSVNNFIRKHPEYEELICNIIDKDLRCRIGASLINQVFPKLIPQFKVALAQEYEDYKHKIDFENEEWYGSRKLDGLRCITSKYYNDIKFYSRSGNEFTTLKNLRNEILKLPIDDIIFDSELCIIDENGNENFNAIQSEYNMKNHIIEKPCIIIFDCLYRDEFDHLKSDVKFIDRLERAKNIITENEMVKILPQTRIHNLEEFEKFKAMGIDLRWEGIMLRKNVGYEGKRTKYLLKDKPFYEIELEVKDIEVGLFRYIVEDKNGITKEIEEIMMTKVIVEYKGYEVRVGSGFSIDERIYYMKYPNDIIGKIITVKYLEETGNKQGGKSLRHGTVKAIHGYIRET